MADPAIEQNIEIQMTRNIVLTVGSPVIFDACKGASRALSAFPYTRAAGVQERHNRP
jgi:hypothetical protein